MANPAITLLFDTGLTVVRGLRERQPDLSADVLWDEAVAMGVRGATVRPEWSEVPFTQLWSGLWTPQALDLDTVLARTVARFVHAVDVRSGLEREAGRLLGISRQDTTDEGDPTRAALGLFLAASPVIAQDVDRALVKPLAGIGGELVNAACDPRATSIGAFALQRAVAGRIVPYPALKRWSTVEVTGLPSFEALAVDPGGAAATVTPPVGAVGDHYLQMLRPDLDLDLAALSGRGHVRPSRVPEATGHHAADDVVEGPTYVNVGVEPGDATGHGGRVDRVEPAEEVWVWVEVGPRNPEALPGDATAIDPDSLPVDEVVEVALFADPGLDVVHAQAVGRLRIARRGAFPVEQGWAGLGDGAPAESAELQTRLYARLRMPAGPGQARLRVALYVRGNLIHVEQVDFWPGDDRPPVIVPAHRIVRDQQDWSAVDSLVPPAVSLYANRNEGSHGISFFVPGTEGDDPLALQCTLPDNRVDEMLGTIRSTLEGASRQPDGKTPMFPVRIDGAIDPVRRLALDKTLIDLAYVGANLWTTFVESLIGAPPAPDGSPQPDPTPSWVRQRLRTALRPPGSLQLSLAGSPNLVLPIDAIYDFELSTADRASLGLCPDCAAWLDAPFDERAPEPPCFGRLRAEAVDESPRPTSADAENLRYQVCLAGFWGFRHATSILPSARLADLSAAITVPGPPAKPPATLARGTGAGIDDYAPAHLAELRAHLAAPTEDATDANALFDQAAANASVLVYLLAHMEQGASGRAGSTVVVRLRTGRGGGIDGNTVRDKVPPFTSYHPIVFLNGCQSAAVDSRSLVNLVAAFIDHGASGAVGTQVEVFVDFAAFFGRVAVEELLGIDGAAGCPLAESLRRARVEALRHGIPFGLAYVAFGLHNLHYAPMPVPT